MHTRRDCRVKRSRKHNKKQVNMGTLFDQPERKWLNDFNIYGELDAIEIIMNKSHLDLTFSDVVSFLTMLELKRRNNLYVHNGDIFDEQMHGIGEILERIENAIKNK